MEKEKLEEILKEHKKWLESAEKEGERANLSSANLSGANLRRANLSYADLSGANLRRANLSYADLSGANLRRANLSYADLSGANLRRANLSYADLSGANLRRANLSYADLSGANLSRANLSYADLSGANLSYADLSYANLSRADLSRADLSGVKNLPNAIDFMNSHFEKTDEGYIVYKTFGSQYNANPEWKIEPNSIIEENVNHTRTQSCGCGINIAPLEWVKKNSKGTIYKLLIKYEWLSEVCVPYNSDGKIRCGRAMILEEVKGE